MAQGWLDKVTINGKIYNSTYGGNFGNSVSFNSTATRVVVGEDLGPQDSGGVLQPYGRVRVYQRISSTSWTQLGQDVIGKAATEHIGFSVAFNSTGDTFVAGAPNKSPGVARVYQLIGSTWTQKGADIASSVTSSKFGSSVAINSTGSIIAVGAPNANSAAGFVAIYEWNGSSWVQVGSNIAGESSLDESGYSLAFDEAGSVLAIGAPKNNAVGKVDAGSVRVYARSGSTWTKRGNDIDGANNNDFFGQAIDLNSTGSVLAVCSNTSTAATKVYEWTGTTWTQKGSAVGSYAGKSVSLASSGNAIAIGSSSRAQVYQWDGNSWAQLGPTIDNLSSTLLLGFGDSIALSNNVDRLVVGAPLGRMSSSAPNGMGLVKIYELGTIPDPSPSPSVTPTRTPTPTPSVTPPATPFVPPKPPSIFDVYKKGNEDGFTRFKRMRLMGYV